MLDIIVSANPLWVFILPDSKATRRMEHSGALTFCSLCESQGNKLTTNPSAPGFPLRHTSFTFHWKRWKWHFLGTSYKHKYGSSSGIFSFHSCICAKLKRTEKQREREKKNDPWLFATARRHQEGIFPVFHAACPATPSFPVWALLINHGWISVLLFLGCFIFLF